MSLKCYKGIEEFITFKSEQIYSEIYDQLDQTIHKFDEKKYRLVVHQYL